MNPEETRIAVEKKIREVSRACDNCDGTGSYKYTFWGEGELDYDMRPCKECPLLHLEHVLLSLNNITYLKCIGEQLRLTDGDGPLEWYDLTSPSQNSHKSFMSGVLRHWGLTTNTQYTFVT
jgi:hypothetical protein